MNKLIQTMTEKPVYVFVGVWLVINTLYLILLGYNAVIVVNTIWGVFVAISIAIIQMIGFGVASITICQIIAQLILRLCGQECLFHYSFKISIEKRGKR